MLFRQQWLPWFAVRLALLPAVVALPVYYSFRRVLRGTRNSRARLARCMAAGAYFATLVVWEKSTMEERAWAFVGMNCQTAWNMRDMVRESCFKFWRPVSWYELHAPRFDAHGRPTAPVELVLSRYKEHLGWVRDVSVPVSIYDHFDRSATHYVPNKGVEASNYVQYIWIVMTHLPT